jgi:hypothetical protein
LKPLPLAPRPINGEIFSSWMARVSAVNGLTIPELLKYACDISTSRLRNVDRDVPRPLITSLAQACRIPQDSLAEVDLCAQLPYTPVWLFLPAVLHVPNGYRRSTISIPSCHVCFWEHENQGTPPYWKTEWSLALVSRCPKHLVLLSANCHHCHLGKLALLAHPTNRRLVVRCTTCFRAGASHPLPDLGEAVRHRTPLVVGLGQALVAAYRGLDPDPMWLGPLPATTFLSVIDDLTWISLGANLCYGSPLIDEYAPATYSEIDSLGRWSWHHPLNLLSVCHREIVVAAIALALLGNRIGERFDLPVRLPLPVSELDSYPFSLIRWPIRRDSHTDIAERIGRWPVILKERALRHLPPAVCRPASVVLRTT